MNRESPAAGYRMRLLCRGILRDRMRATFQMHLYQARNRRFGRRSSTTNAAVRYAPQARDELLEQEHLGFHPALAYKYSGEH